MNLTPNLGHGNILMYHQSGYDIVYPICSMKLVIEFTITLSTTSYSHYIPEAVTRSVMDCYFAVGRLLENHRRSKPIKLLNRSHLDPHFVTSPVGCDLSRHRQHHLPPNFLHLHLQPHCCPLGHSAFRVRCVLMSNSPLARRIDLLTFSAGRPFSSTMVQSRRQRQALRELP